MRLKEILMEMPLGTFKQVGDFSKKGSFEDEADRKILSNPLIADRVREKFAGVPQKIDMYFVNDPHTSGTMVMRELGRVDSGDLTSLIPNFYRDKDAITIVYTNNAATEQVPMTPWIVAHRMGHAFFSPVNSPSNPCFYEAYTQFDGYIKKLCEVAYDVNSRYDYRKELITALCTFRSARQKNMRSQYEAIYELFAQYIISGEISFNSLPTSFSKYTLTDNKKKLEETDILLHSMKVKVEAEFKAALEFAVGKIWLI